ncbi:MAG: class I adenylate-forming enzyme family protein [Anaerolineales bacterium]|nr:MAG: class I adenylate-forming enzyme family protein [Anaerolineales bacterium]
MQPSLITEFLELQAIKNPSKVAITQNNHEYTYRELDLQANQVARWLLDKNVQAGDRVIILGSNEVNVIVALFGIAKIDAIFVLLNPSISKRNLQYVLSDCTPKVIIVDYSVWRIHTYLSQAFSKNILLLQTKVNIEIVDPSTYSWDHVYSYSDTSILFSIEPTDIAAIIYTSGSTNYPKGVIASHNKIVFATLVINSILQNSENDVILCGIPLSFDYGLYQVFLAFTSGAKLVLEREFKVPMDIPRLIKIHGVTGLPGVPSLFAMLLRSGLLERVELPGLRYITSTGDVFPEAHIAQLRELLPKTTIIPMYGLTECKRVSIMPIGALDHHMNSVGLPLPGTQVRIIDEFGHVLEPGKTGQLIVQGPHVMNGYWNDSAETQRRFRFDPITAGTWLYTGDYFKADYEGFLYYMGRDEMVIKSSGQKISPVEIEAFLCTIREISEAAAIGIPDPILGEVISIFVTPKTPGSISIDSIIKLCKEGLSPIENPRRIVLLDTPLPKTPNGKIDRKHLKSQILSGELP